jgi:hypothetical protein
MTVRTAVSLSPNAFNTTAANASGAPIVAPSVHAQNGARLYFLQILDRAGDVTGLATLWASSPGAAIHLAEATCAGTARVQLVGACPSAAPPAFRTEWQGSR